MEVSMMASRSNSGLAIAFWSTNRPQTQRSPAGRARLKGQTDNSNQWIVINYCLLLGITSARARILRVHPVDAVMWERNSTKTSKRGSWMSNGRAMLLFKLPQCRMSGHYDG
ncbi:Urea active transporter [Fusarium oxysporum f. sp. albedinis]|nr:Urea active transporter [Fusarium oxysporum f. sp. albedinis]